ncbi:hypothetical protein Q8F55_000804 [Vanrija albida]|uniref:Uncharacterized protein n=1 Tax=Vanrija albida TaxID=181172 RepID=A0ABR3QEA9_9TREE
MRTSVLLYLLPLLPGALSAPTARKNKSDDSNSDSSNSDSSNPDSSIPVAHDHKISPYWDGPINLRKVGVDGYYNDNSPIMEGVEARFSDANGRTPSSTSWNATGNCRIGHWGLRHWDEETQANLWDAWVECVEYAEEITADIRYIGNVFQCGTGLDQEVTMTLSHSETSSSSVSANIGFSYSGFEIGLGMEAQDEVTSGAEMTRTLKCPQDAEPNLLCLLGGPALIKYSVRRGWVKIQHRDEKDGHVKGTPHQWKNQGDKSKNYGMDDHSVKFEYSWNGRFETGWHVWETTGDMCKGEMFKGEYTPSRVFGNDKLTGGGSDSAGKDTSYSP